MIAATTAGAVGAATIVGAVVIAATLVAVTVATLRAVTVATAGAVAMAGAATTVAMAAMAGKIAACHGPPAEHKFRTGQRVMLTPSLMNRSAAGGGYVVTRQLPERDGEFEYRIRSMSESHERVARESQLAVQTSARRRMRAV
jgi:hypothetical protein